MPKLTADMKRLAGLTVAVAGVLVIALGAFFVAQGWSARQEIRTRMLDEGVTTTIDDVQVPVTDQRTAMNQADLIREHTLGTFGTYSSLDREDPRRATYITGLTLRNSLTLARMGLDVSNLVMGLGAIFLAVGGSFAVTGAVVAASATRAVETETSGPVVREKPIEAEALA